MNKTIAIFVGNKKSNPTFLVEIIEQTNQISVYKPDKYSKNQDFYEKYSLGKLYIQTNYDDINFITPIIPYKNYFLFTSNIIFKIKNKYLSISNIITELQKKKI